MLRLARAAARPVLVAGTVLGLVAASQAGLSSRATTDAATYTLQAGDTRTAVAGRFNVTVKDLAGANGITNPDFVLVGDTLTIPGRPPTTPAAPAPAPAAAGPSASKLPPALLGRPDRLALAATFDKWAKAYGVAPDLLKALAWMESGWQSDVVSGVGARGIGQLTPDTVRFVSDRLLKTHLDAKVPEDNIRMSARFLAYLIGQVGDERLGLAAYYQGLGSLRKYGPLPVSRLYVDDIMALRPLFT